jgi:hypothetical protein
LFPRIEYLEAQIREITHVPRNENKVVLKRGCGDQAVWRRDRLPLQLTFAVKMPTFPQSSR